MYPPSPTTLAQLLTDAHVKFLKGVAHHLDNLEIRFRHPTLEAQRGCLSTEVNPLGSLQCRGSTPYNETIKLEIRLITVSEFKVNLEILGHVGPSQVYLNSPLRPNEASVDSVASTIVDVVHQHYNKTH